MKSTAIDTAAIDVAGGGLALDVHLHGIAEDVQLQAAYELADDTIPVEFWLEVLEDNHDMLVEAARQGYQLALAEITEVIHEEKGKRS